MLGLGDIIIPGLFASMCIRCDLINAFRIGKENAIKEGIRNDKEAVARLIEKEMNCSYFYTTLIGYFVGMTATYAALGIY